MNTDRITELAKSQGKTLTYLCSLVGRPRYYLKSARASGVSIPREYLEVFAADLGVSVEYLSGETDDPAMCEEARKNTVTYYRNEQKVVKRLRPEQMKMLAEMIDGIRTDEG